jgi:hypothetical protein
MSDGRKRLFGCEYRKRKLRNEEQIKKYTSTITSFVRVEPRSSATKAAVFVADGLTPIENEDEHNVTERSSPAIGSTSEKLGLPENSKKTDSEKDIGVEVTTDPGSWTEILPEETRMPLIEVGPVQVHNIVFPKYQFGISFSLYYYYSYK